ncbi:MAG TPA: FHA domain-containing protein [Rhodocyclaceae bacterium]|jgi:pSer/pThr/pTyr-binding forkhead associated (FHA) protein|nr:FHA domain-containing protein [Rhodocyclaceae bacterium]
MAKLILSMDGLVLKDISVSKERMSIGRKSHNDIQIDNLAISGEHAVIVTLLNDSFLEDLGSTNGTAVNGQSIKRHFLQDGDVIELGKYKLKYVNEAVQQTTPADFEKTVVLRPDMLRQTVAQVESKGFGDTQVGAAALGLGAADAAATPVAPVFAEAAHVAPAQPPMAAIQVLSGSGKTLDLVKSLTTLGKPGVQVAVIARRPQGYFITHVEGAGFPVVNGKTLDAQAHALADHDVIEIAGVKMEFFFKS